MLASVARWFHTRRKLILLSADNIIPDLGIVEKLELRILGMVGGA
jgi:hypothetical protein